MQDIQMFLPIGSVLHDRYRVEELLGKGSSGAVYLVQDLHKVAISKGDRLCIYNLETKGLAAIIQVISTFQAYQKSYLDYKKSSLLFIYTAFL